MKTVVHVTSQNEGERTYEGTACIAAENSMVEVVRPNRKDKEQMEVTARFFRSSVDHMKVVNDVRHVYLKPGRGRRKEQGHDRPTAE